MKNYFSTWAFSCPLQWQALPLEWTAEDHISLCHLAGCSRVVNTGVSTFHHTMTPGQVDKWLKAQLKPQVFRRTMDPVVIAPSKCKCRHEWNYCMKSEIYSDSTSHSMGQYSATPRSKVPGPTPSPGAFLSLPVLPLPVCFPSSFSSFLPRSKDMHSRFISKSKLCCSSLYVGPVIDRQPGCTLPDHR